MQDWCCVIERYEPTYNPYYERAVYWTPRSQYKNYGHFNTGIRHNSNYNQFGTYRPYNAVAQYARPTPYNYNCCTKQCNYNCSKQFPSQYNTYHTNASTTRGSYVR